VTGGDAVGAIDMTFREPRTFDPEEIAFISAVAEQGASALERARLHDVERRERKRAAFLDALGGLLAQSLNFDRTLAKVARLVVHGVRVGGEEIDGLADRCSIALLQPDGSIQLAAIEDSVAGTSEPPSPQRDRADAEAIERAARVLRTGRSELTLVRRGGAHPRSVITVALSARGRTFGAIETVREGDGGYGDDDDFGFAEEVAGRAATAIDNARLYRERGEIARTLQRALKPHDPPPIRGIELATRYLAAGEGIEVGGDFYEIWEFEDEHALWICIGDVTGKGPSAVDLNLLARHTIRAAAMRGDGPEIVLRTLNRALLERESTDRFCTAITCRLDLSSEPLRGTIACGGHPLPLVLRVDGTLGRIGAPGTLLGLFGDIDIEERPFELEIGDTMVLYTDGVIEERAGARQFGIDGLAAELVRSRGRSADRVAETIERAVRGIRPEGELLDDVALVVVRPVGQAPSDVTAPATGRST
jgi:GAF domain-containing protein